MAWTSARLSAQGYDLDSYPGGVNFDGVPEFVEKVEAAAADESNARCDC